MVEVDEMSAAGKSLTVQHFILTQKIKTRKKKVTLVFKFLKCGKQTDTENIWLYATGQNQSTLLITTV